LLLFELSFMPPLCYLHLLLFSSLLFSSALK
jgi:hypothetical protein